MRIMRAPALLERVKPCSGVEQDVAALRLLKKAAADQGDLLEQERPLASGSGNHSTRRHVPYPSSCLHNEMLT